MKKQLISLFLLLALTTTVQAAKADISATALPELSGAVNGSVTTSGAKMDVKTNAGTGTVSQFDWSTFNVGKDAQVNWVFNGHSQTSINRVLDTNMSQIYGKLTSSCGAAGCGYNTTSKVILINPNGLLFGNGSSVNLNSFTAATNDIVGIKNIKGMTSSELTDYGKYVNNNYTYNKTISFRGSESAPGSKIELNNSKWDVDKSVAILAKDIKIKDSAIRTTLGYNGKTLDENGNTVDGSFSNVRLITSNGADFYYVSNGDLPKAGIKSAVNKTTKYNMDVDNSEITSGYVSAYNNGENLDSNINIKNSVIKGTKLVRGESGDIIIAANSKVNVDKSQLLTQNSSQSGAKDKATGKVSITGGQEVNVVNGSKIATAETTASDPLNPVLLKSPYGNVNVKNSDINSAGELAAYANNTLFENSALNYNKSDLYKEGQVNNVTVKGTTTITDRSSDKLVLETNGNLTLDNATVRKYQSTSNNQKAIDLISAKDVNIINASDVTATTGAITANAANNVNVINSKLTAKTTN